MSKRKLCCILNPVIKSCNFCKQPICQNCWDNGFHLLVPVNKREFNMWWGSGGVKGVHRTKGDIRKHDIVPACVNPWKSQLADLYTEDDE